MSRTPQYLIELNHAQQETIGEWQFVERKGGPFPSYNTRRVFCLLPDVKEWCDANIPKRHRYALPYNVIFTTAGQVELLFWDTSDIILFKMRWL